MFPVIFTENILADLMFFYKKILDLCLIWLVKYKNMSLHILISPLNHSLIEIKEIMFVCGCHIFLHMSSQAVKACCGNIHLADTKRDRSLEIFVRDTTAAMKNQRNVHFLMDLLQYIKSKSRCYRIVTVCIADGNCKSIDTCLSCINNCIIRVCAADTMVTASILTSAYKTKLSLCLLYTSDAADEL